MEPQGIGLPVSASYSTYERKGEGSLNALLDAANNRTVDSEQENPLALTELSSKGKGLEVSQVRSEEAAND